VISCDGSFADEKKMMPFFLLCYRDIVGKLKFNTFSFSGWLVNINLFEFTLTKLLL